MKNFSPYLFGLFISLSLVLSALPGHTQDLDQVKVTIPFDFVVGTMQFKAGDYIVDSLLDGTALRLHDKSGNVQQIAFTVPAGTKQPRSHERLLFHHDGDQYFLSQVWFSGNEGRDLVPGAREKNSSKNRPVSDQTVVGQ
jgi:hypothetical protein